MPILGSGVVDTNFRLRFCLIVFCGIIGFGVTMAWRAEVLLAADYQEMPTTHEQLKIKKQNEQKRKSLQEKLIQTQVEDN